MAINEQDEFEFRARAEQEAKLKARHPMAGEGIHDVTPSKEGMRTALQFGIPAATTLAAAAMPVPAALARFAPMFVKEGIGSVVGEGINQLTGISDYSPLQLGAAAVAPGLGRGVVATGSKLLRYVPGIGKAIGAEEAQLVRQMESPLLSGPSYDELNRQVMEGNIKAVLPQWEHLGKAVAELETKAEKVPWEELSKAMKDTKVAALLENIQTTLHGAPATVTKHTPTVSGKAQSLPTGLPKQAVTTAAKSPGMTFEEADAAVKGLGHVIRNTSDDAVRGNYKKLYGAMLNDLETMPAPPGTPVDTWKAARQRYKLEKAQSLLSDEIEKAMKPVEGVDYFKGDRVVKWIHTNKEFRDRVPPAKLREVEALFRDIARMETKNASAFMGLLVGAAVGGNVSGALAGYVAADALGKVWLSEGGRKLVRLMMRDPRSSRARKAASLVLAGAAGAFAEPGPLPMPFGSGELQPAP